MNYTLDLYTLVIALSVVYLSSLAMSLLLYLSKETFKGAHYWITGQFLIAFGTVVMQAQVLNFPYFLTCLANTSFLASLVFFYHSLWLFFENKKPFPWYAHLTIPAVFGLWLLMEGQSINFRTIVFSIITIPGNAGIFIILMKKAAPEFRKSAFVTGLPFLVLSIASAVRIPLNLFTEPVYQIEEQSEVNIFVYLLSIFTAFFALFGYYMMSSVRAETELKKRDSEIVARNRELVKLNSTKDTLFSIIAHDLRGPISSAARYVTKHLLPPDVSLENKKEALIILAKSLERTQNLMENLLSWARSQSGEISLKPQILAMKAICQEALEFLEKDISSKNLSVNVGEGDVRVLADLQTISVVIRNILSNAIKFTPQGGCISLRFDEAGQSAEISIGDTGVGMNAEHLSRIFSIHNKVVTNGTDGEQGSGFGLLLCKEFMEKNNGSLRAASKPGAGSVFTLVLPKA